MPLSTTQAPSWRPCRRGACGGGRGAGAATSRERWDRGGAFPCPWAPPYRTWPRTWPSPPPRAAPPRPSPAGPQVRRATGRAQRREGGSEETGERKKERKTGAYKDDTLLVFVDPHDEGGGRLGHVTGAVEEPRDVGGEDRERQRGDDRVKAPKLVLQVRHPRLTWRKAGGGSAGKSSRVRQTGASTSSFDGQRRY